MVTLLGFFGYTFFNSIAFKNLTTKSKLPIVTIYADATYKVLNFKEHTGRQPYDKGYSPELTIASTQLDGYHAWTTYEWSLKDLFTAPNITVNMVEAADRLMYSAGWQNNNSPTLFTLVENFDYAKKEHRSIERLYIRPYSSGSICQKINYWPNPVTRQNEPVTTNITIETEISNYCRPNNNQF